MSLGGGIATIATTIKTSNEHNTTKKNRSVNPKLNKKQLWDQIENSFNNDATERNVTGKGSSNNLECVYRSSGQRENCDYCDSIVCLTDDGFLTCTNQK